MGDYTRVHDPKSGWEFVCSSAAVPEGVEVLDTEAAPGPPVRHDDADSPSSEPKNESPDPSGSSATPSKTKKSGTSGDNQES